MPSLTCARTHWTFEPMTRPAPNCKLQVRGLAFGYSAEPLQRDVSFDVEKGSIFAIMGTSGCGKSTLLKALIGLLRPLSGAIIVDGNDYCRLDEGPPARTVRSFAG